MLRLNHLTRRGQHRTHEKNDRCFSGVALTSGKLTHSSGFHRSLTKEEPRPASDRLGFLPQLLLISQSDWLICRGR